MNNDELLKLAQDVRAWIDGSGSDPQALTASLTGTLHDEVTRVWPDARQFGRSILRAATANESCRWCVARADARALKLLTPGRFRALRGLLGEPCDGCFSWAQTQLRRKTSARVGGETGFKSRSGGREGRRAAATQSSVAGAASDFPHRVGTCATCFQAREANRKLARGESLTASARDALTAGSAPHARMLAPTGVVRPIVHNGVGACMNCSCAECRGARIATYQQRGDLVPRK